MVVVPEDGPRDPLVAAARKPAAALVSPAQVKAECDAGKIPDDGVVHLDAAFQVALRAPALGFVEDARRRIEQQRIVGRVELDVGRAEPRHAWTYPVSVDGFAFGSQALIHKRARAALHPHAHVHPSAQPPTERALRTVLMFLDGPGQCERWRHLLSEILKARSALAAK
jgi:hypothetical protein